MGKVVAPLSKGTAVARRATTVGTGDSSGATDDEVDPVAGPTGVGNVVFSPGKSTAGTESGESSGADDEADPVPTEINTSGKAEEIEEVGELTAAIVAQKLLKCTGAHKPNAYSFGGGEVLRYDYYGA